MILPVVGIKVRNISGITGQNVTPGQKPGKEKTVGAKGGDFPPGRGKLCPGSVAGELSVVLTARRRG